MDRKLILVPTSFSKVDYVALNHASVVARKADADIMLVHVVPKSDQLDEAKEKLRLAKEIAQEDFNIVVKTTARVGSVFDDIGDLANEMDAVMVVMGTHGMRGLQFITGSRALRIVTHSNTPFIITQEREIGENGYDDIVVPLDLNKETKQKLNLVADMAKYFDSRVHIIVPGEKDEFLKNAVARNVKYAQSFFDEMKIPHTAKVSDRGSDNFDDAIIEYATEIDADLISIMNLAENSLSSLLGGSYVQKIITNKPNIPAMVLNPKSIGSVSVFGAYVGVG